MNDVNAMDVISYESGVYMYLIEGMLISNVFTTYQSILLIFVNRAKRNLQYQFTQMNPVNSEMEK